MSYFEPAVITGAGMNLIANDIAGIGNIEFVKMVSGAGEYTEEEKTKSALAERTALKEQRQEFGFNAIEVKSEKSVLLKSVISNQTLEEGYRITEVGIYAREKGTDGEGVLYSIALAIEADFLPPFNGLNPSEIVQEYYATVSDAAETSIISAPGAFALYEDLKALERAFNDKFEEFVCIINDPENEYHENSTYVLGEYCVYNGQIYTCIMPIEVPEEWNEEHWEKTTITKELWKLMNKEVELVDPTIATEVGFAADAKLTGDVLREVSTNLEALKNAVSDSVKSLSGTMNSIKIGAGGTTVTVTITFKTPFNNIPKVTASATGFLTVDYVNPANVSANDIYYSPTVTVKNITKSSFQADIKAKNYGGAGTIANLSWNAYAPIVSE